MPKGTSFTLTPARRAKMTEMLRKQWTVSGLACEYGINYKVLIKLFKKEKFDHKAIRMSGLLNLRAETFETIADIDDNSKRVDAGLKFLNQYPIAESEVDDDIDGSTDAEIAEQILKELGDEN